MKQLQQQHPARGTWGHTHTWAWDPPTQSRWGGQAPTAELQGHCTCLGGPLAPPWVVGAGGTGHPTPPQHLSMLCWLCQAVPRWCHWHHLHCPLPGTQIPALWHHLAGSMGLGRLQRAEGPPVFSVVSAKLPRLRRALSHGHPHPRPQPLSQAFYKKCIIKTTPHHHSRPA